MLEKYYLLKLWYYLKIEYIFIGLCFLCYKKSFEQKIIFLFYEKEVSLQK